jgi:hypothetical protein
MSIKSIFILLMCISLTSTLAHADFAETDLNRWQYTQQIGTYHDLFIETPSKNTLASQDSIAFQRSALPYEEQAKGQNRLSLGGVSFSLHSELGSGAPFFGAFAYHRQPVSFTHTGREQTVNLGWLGGVEYTDASWGGSFLGIDTRVDAEIFLISAMVGTDFQTQSGIFMAGGGFAFHAMTLGVGLELFGIETSSSDEYTGLTPTALIAYTMHTSSGGIAEGSITFYARYQGQGVMIGMALGLMEFE